MPRLPEFLLSAVDQQIDSPETPFVRAAYRRLLDHHPDIDSDEARRLIALCLADETEHMVAEDRPFDLARYESLLDLLPHPPGR